MPARPDLPPEVLRAIRPATWHALFAARGYPSPVAASTFTAKSATPASVLSAIASALARASSPLPPLLAHALFLIPAFATDIGRIDIYDAADALGFATRWPDAISPADLIATLLAVSVTDARVHELVRTAKVARDRAFRPRATLVYVGAPQGDPNVGEPSQYVPTWRDAFGTWARSRDFGAVVEVEAGVSAGVLSWEIVHEDRWTAPFLAAASPILPQRTLRSHRVTYEPARRCLKIVTDALEAATPLARIAGTVLFGAGRHFLDPPAVNLWTLQEHGAGALLVPELAGKLTMSAIGGTWHSGKDHAITPRGRDFFKALQRYKIRIEGGRLDLLTLRAQLPAGVTGPAQCDVALCPPHLVTVSEPELASLMDEFLDGAKITNPAPRPRDFFSLQPWIESRAAWIEVEGQEGFYALLARGLLRADRTNRTVAPPEHPHAGRTATAYPLGEGSKKYLAWSPDRTVAPFIVTEEDLVLYALSFEKLAATIAAALGLAGQASKLDDDGVLLCGRRELGPTHVVYSLATRPVRMATVARLIEAAGHGHAILIGPEGRRQELGIRQLAMPKLAGPWEPLLAATVRALKLEKSVNTTVYAPAQARVVLHRATKRVWIDRVLCTKITEAHFLLLEILVMNAGQAVDTKDIAQHIAKGNQHADTTRRAVESLPVAIERSFAAVGKAVPGDLKGFIGRPKLGRYVLGVAGFVD